MNFENCLDQGGPIMWLLVALNVLGWSLMFWKAITILLFKKNKVKNLELFSNYYKRMKRSSDDRSSESKFDSALSSFIHPYHSGMNTIRIIATISPLLGLLGTVVGILSSFTVIAQKGLSNPALFAEGISLALITTVAGLVVAIPHLIGYNYLKSSLHNLERLIEELSMDLGD